MPLYDYQCQSCGHVVEVTHGVNGLGPQRCARCGGEMRKLLSPPAIVFKGSGWAKKDARLARPAGTGKSATDTDVDNKPASTEAKVDNPGAGSGTSGADSAA